MPEVVKLFFNYLLVTMLFWAAHNLLRSERVARGALLSFTAGCACAAALNVAGVATQLVVSDQTTRSIVFGQNADVLGANMALGLVMLMVVTFDGGAALARPRVIAGALVAVVIAKSLMLVGSRGAIVGVVAGVLRTRAGPETCAPSFVTSPSGWRRAQRFPSWSIAPTPS